MNYNKTNLEDDPWRWTRYNEMMAKREVINFDNPYFCKRCGKRRGDHVIESVRRKNPNCCPFVSK